MLWWISTKVGPSQVWLRLLAWLASLIGMVPFCRLHMGKFQINLLSHYHSWFHNRSLLVPVPQSLLSNLHWWTGPHNVTMGVPFNAPSPSITLTSEASKLRSPSGWRAIGKLPSLNAKSMSLNCGLSFLGQGQDRARSLWQHNSGDVYQQRGESRSPSLCRETLKLLKWCKDRDIKLVACHVPGMDRCSLPERHTDTSSTEGEGIVGGVATPPVSLLLNIPETRPSTRGPVCFCQESSTSSLLFMESRPPGPGTRCNDGRLVRAPVYYSWSPGS